MNVYKNKPAWAVPSISSGGNADAFVFSFALPSTQGSPIIL
jgi:hypothetical protein